MSDPENGEGESLKARILEFPAPRSISAGSRPIESTDPAIVFADHVLRYLEVAIEEYREKVELVANLNERLSAEGQQTMIRRRGTLYTLKEHIEKNRRDLDAIIRPVLDDYTLLLGWLARPPQVASEQATFREKWAHYMTQGEGNDNGV